MARPIKVYIQKKLLNLYILSKGHCKYLHCDKLNNILPLLMFLCFYTYFLKRHCECLQYDKQNNTLPPLS